MEQSVNKYAKLSFAEAKHAVERDFEEKARYVDRSQCNFIYAEFPEFTFSLMQMLDGEPLALVAHGSGKYAGFLLNSANVGKGWHCSVMDGIAYRATGGAKKMADVMAKKYGVTDTTRLFKKYRN